MIEFDFGKHQLLVIILKNSNFQFFKFNFYLNSKIWFFRIFSNCHIIKIFRVPSHLNTKNNIPLIYFYQIFLIFRSIIKNSHFLIALIFILLWVHLLIPRTLLKKTIFLIKNLIMGKWRIVKKQKIKKNK